MELTHGLALFFSIVFIVIATIFNKFIWWLLSILYLLALAFMAVLNQWEVLFFPPLVIFSIISLAMVVVTSFKGEWY